MIGIIEETPAPANGYRFKVKTSDDIHYCFSPMPFRVGDRVKLNYMSTSTRGWYALAPLETP